MNRFLSTLAVTAAMSIGAASASTQVLPLTAPTSRAIGSVFADLAAFGYDLGRFRPDYTGRFPYR